MSSVKRVRSFTVKEKLEVIGVAEQIGNRAAGRQYDVSESCIRDWRKNIQKLLASDKYKRAFRSGIRKFPQVEELLSSYILHRRQQGFAVSTKMAQLKAIEIAKDLQIADEDFKASRGWFQRFKDRHGLSKINSKTSDKRLWDAYEEKYMPPFELVECGEEPTTGYEEQVPPVRQHSILESILEKPKATGRNANRNSSEKKRKRKEEKAATATAAATQTTNGDDTSHDGNAETLSLVDATQLKKEVQETLSKRVRVEEQNSDVVGGDDGASGSTSSEQFAEVLIKEEVMLVDAPMAKNVFEEEEEEEELPIVEIKQESSVDDEYNPLDAATVMEEN